MLSIILDMEVILESLGKISTPTVSLLILVSFLYNIQGISMNFIQYLEPASYFFPQWTPLYYPLFVLPPVVQNQKQISPEIKEQQIPPSKIPIAPQICFKPRRNKIKKRQAKVQQGRHELNIKNIIPNLTRKLLGFLISQNGRRLMLKIDPQITKPEISRLYTFVKSVKNTIGTYVGKKNLRKLWYKQSKTPKSLKTYEIIRRMSRYYLENQCINSILASKKIKSELKMIHLEYRRMLLDMLNGNIVESQ